MLKKM